MLNILDSVHFLLNNAIPSILWFVIFIVKLEYNLYLSVNVLHLFSNLKFSAWGLSRIYTQLFSSWIACHCLITLFLLFFGWGRNIIIWSLESERYKIMSFHPIESNPILHKLMSQMNNYRVFGSKKERKKEMKIALSSNSDAGGIHWVSSSQTLCLGYSICWPLVSMHSNIV